MAGLRDVQKLPFRPLVAFDSKVFCIWNGLIKSPPALLCLLLAGCYDPSPHLIKPKNNSIIIFDEDHLLSDITVEELEPILRRRGSKELGNVVKDFGYLRGNSGLIRMKVQQDCRFNEEDFAPTLRQVLLNENFVCYDVVGDNSWAELWRD